MSRLDRRLAAPHSVARKRMGHVRGTGSSHGWQASAICERRIRSEREQVLMKRHCAWKHRLKQASETKKSGHIAPRTVAPAVRREEGSSAASRKDPPKRKLHSCADFHASKMLCRSKVGQVATLLQGNRRYGPPSTGARGTTARAATGWKAANTAPRGRGPTPSSRAHSTAPAAAMPKWPSTPIKRETGHIGPRPSRPAALDFVPKMAAVAPRARGKADYATNHERRAAIAGRKAD